MRLLKWLCFLLFLAALLHASIVVGAMGQLGFAPGKTLAGPAYDRMLKKEGFHFYYPMQVYGALGRAAWKSGLASRIVNNIYRPLIRRYPQQARLALNMRYLNWLVLGSLAAWLLLSLLGAGRRGGRY